MMRPHAMMALLAGTVATTLVGVPPAAAATSCQGENATVVGTGGRDVLRGTDGPDVIAGLGGADRIFGGGGYDVVCGNAGPDYIRGNGGRDRLRGNQGDDAVRGNSGPDQVYGDYGSDTVEGGWGADHVDGGPGRLVRDRTDQQVEYDLLRGGPGDDRLVPGKDERGFGTRWDRISYDSADGPVQVNAVFQVVRGDGVDTYPADVRVEIVGSPYGDEMTGSPGPDILFGGKGGDLMIGNDGDDRLIGGGGADEIRGNRGVDGLQGGSGRDRLLGGKDDDVIHDDGLGPDRINGQSGYDYVSDRLNWGDGHVVRGGAGRDFLHMQSDQSGPDARRRGHTDLRSGLTVIFERPRIHASILGFEEVALPRAPWSIYGSAADETVQTAGFSGGTPRFAIDARMRAGNDLMYGTRKNDTFFGGSGHDTVHDHGGVDVCRSIEVQLGSGTPCDR